MKPDIAAICLMIASLSAPAGATKAPMNLPVDAFATLPFLGDVELSPDGRYAAATALANGKYGVVIYDLDPTGKKPFIASPGDWDVNWVHWKSANRLLISARFASRRYGTAVLETRLVAMNADGSDLQNVVEPTKAELDGQKIVQIQDRVVDFLPDDPRRVMLAFNPDDAARPRLYKVDIYSARRETIETGRATIQDWLLGRQGRVRIAQGRDVNDNKGGSYKTYYRAKDSDDWTEIWDSTEKAATLDPRMFDREDPDVIWAVSDHEDGRDGLYRFRISTREFIETIFHDPRVDLDAVYMNPKGDEIEGYRYVTDISHEKWLSPRMAAISDDLHKLMPGWVIRIRSRSDQESRLIVSASASDHSERYYLYDSAAKKLTYFGFTYPNLDKFDLARVMPVHYKARDGLEIQAYLTLPTAATNPPAAPMPAVIYPHGGPEARDYADFDPFVQMLVNRGYAVLQMNYRGSTGFGSDFQQAGRQAWGEAMQDDVTDGTRWLVEQKIADPARICIMGGSYGGYAALMGAVKEPKLYRCTISFNGVTDLPDLIAHESNFVGGRGASYMQIGGIWTDREQLARNSPARHADRIQVPVLLLHGTDDRVVPITQTRKMASALKSEGKQFRYVELEDEEHWLTHNATRLQAFREVDGFLAEQLK